MHLRPSRLVPVPSPPRGPDAPRAADATIADGEADAALVAGIRAGEPDALAELHDRFARPVLRILTRVLGPDRELKDLHHDVFVRALSSIGELRDPRALRGWMSAIAVHTARASIERRSRQRRWTFLSADGATPEPEPIDPRDRHDAREALRATYALLDRMPVAERIPFALRYLDAMELEQIAQASRVSLASIKRRLARAEARFTALARRTPELKGYLEGGSRWTLE